MEIAWYNKTYINKQILIPSQTITIDIRQQPIRKTISQRMPQRHDSNFIKKLSQLDANPYSIQLNYKNKHCFKSATGGCISLIFYLAAAVVIGLNSYYYFTQSEFIFNQIQIKNDLTNVNLTHSNFGVLLSAYSENGPINITYDQLDDYGLSVTVQEMNKSYGQPSKSVPAVQGRHIKIFDFSQFLSIPPQIDFNLSGSSSVFSQHKYHSVAITIRNISNQIANQQGKQIQKFTNLSVKFVFINNVANPKQQPPIFSNKVRLFNVKDGLNLINNELQQLSFYFKKLWISTDRSIFFFQQNQQKNQTIYDEQSTYSLYSNKDASDNRLVVINLKRSLYTIHYDRYYKKLPTYLAQTFGVIGLISLIFLIYRGYNRWCFTENQLIPQKYRAKTNIFKYYHHLLRNLKKITVSSQFYQQFEHNLDIQKILKRLDDFEERLRKLEGRSQMIYEQGHQPQFARKKSNTRQKHKINQRLLDS